MSPVESNEVPFEVIEDDVVTPRTGIEVSVYSQEFPSQIIDVLGRRFEPTYLNEVNRVGAGSVKISLRDKKILETTDLLEERNIVKLSLDQQVIGAFIIQNPSTVWVERGEFAAEMYEVRGEGLRTWLNDADVHPYGGLKLKSYDQRVFSFASEQGSWYNEDDWVTPVNVAQYSIDPESGSPWGTAPAEWPDAESAYWIWNGTSSTPGIGYSYFRYEFDIAEEIGTAQYSIFASADDELDLYLDSAKILEGKDQYAWSKTYRADFELDPGHHIIAARVRNVRGRAGFISAFFRAGDATAEPPTEAELLKVTGESGWLINAYPDPPPGWTPGEIMLTLLAEAEARDIRMATTLVPTFTATHDSDGAAWSRSLDWSFDIGSSYLSVVEKLEEVVCDLWINPANYELNMSASQGVHRDEQVEGLQPVQFQIGRNLLRAGEQSEADLKNALIMRTAEGYVGYEDSLTDSITKYGRLEGFVSNDASLELAGDVALAVFARHAEPLRSATFEIIDVDDARPYVNFYPGDWVLAPGRTGQESRRVMSISVAEDSKSGKPIFAVEFDTITEDREMRLERWLKTTQPGTLSGTVANSGGGGATATQPSGATGSQGPSGGSGDPGTGFTWKGDWSNPIEYVINDVVYYNGASWIAVADNVSSAPSDANANWDRMTSNASLTDAQVAAYITGPGDTRDALEDVTGEFRSAAPSSGTWAVADKVWNTLPSPGDYVGWVCVSAGTPGTWKGFGLIET